MRHLPLPRWTVPGLTAALLLVASPSRADVSSWLFVGGGAGWLVQPGDDELAPALQFDLGVGLPPSSPVVVGALARVTPYLGHGTDLALVARTASRGFVTGDWGLALDAGPYGRWWGAESSGFTGALQLGAPYGLTLGLNASVGSNEQRTFGAVIGVDLLRLTVYRLGGQNWWSNPRPAWRPDEPSIRP